MPRSPWLYWIRSARFSNMSRRATGCSPQPESGSSSKGHEWYRGRGAPPAVEGQPSVPPRAVFLGSDGSGPAAGWLTAARLDRLGRIRVWLARDWFALALSAIVLLGAGLRFYALDYQSLWTDEIFSLITTDPASVFGEVWDRVLADTHPPIYYLCLWLWSTLFGQSAIAARLPSAFFGVLTVCAAAILPGPSLSRTSRLAFPLLIAISPGAVWYARETRSYALLLLMATIITLACIRFLSCPPQQERRAQASVIMLTSAALVASFTHYFGSLLAAAAFLACFLLTSRHRRALVMLAAFGLAACFAPWVVYHSHFADSERAAWIGKFSVADSIGWFEYLSFGGTVSLVLFIGTAAALFAAGGWRRLAQWNSTIWVCAFLCLLTFAAGTAISLHTPVLTSRNMIVVLPALYLIAAELSSSLVTHWSKISGTIYLAAQAGLMSQPLAAYYTAEMAEQWRDSAAVVLRTPGCESGAIHVYGDARHYRFFTKSVRPDLRLIEIPQGAAAVVGDDPTPACPIVLWIVGPIWELDGLLLRSGLSPDSLRVADFYYALVILHKQP
jgi:mannosyltransferase